ncbi:hypothetical protein [Lolliginicoccus suaedae]|uniref:hypothetical protein n=1 Tax=Lolliginicoccus suaedae TaxID=2605429 RepID=UPI0011EE0A69|nr:hypothetical protein [Lolliginicoccus suaedae]
MDPTAVTVSMTEPQHLRELLACAVRETYDEDRHLIEADIREEAVVFRIAHRLADWIERPGSLRHVDVEYDRRYLDGQQRPKYEVTGDSHVTPDLIVHTRGVDTQNLLVVEAKKVQPIGDRLTESVEELQDFRSELNYASAVLLVLAPQPVWRWIGESETFTDIPITADATKADQREPDGQSSTLQ